MSLPIVSAVANAAAVPVAAVPAQAAVAPVQAVPVVAPVPVQPQPVAAVAGDPTQRFIQSLHTYRSTVQCIGGPGQQPTIEQYSALLQLASDAEAYMAAKGHPWIGKGDVYLAGASAEENRLIKMVLSQPNRATLVNANAVSPEFVTLVSGTASWVPAV